MESAAGAVQRTATGASVDQRVRDGENDRRRESANHRRTADRDREASAAGRAGVGGCQRAISGIGECKGTEGSDCTWERAVNDLACLQLEGDAANERLEQQLQAKDAEIATV